MHELGCFASTYCVFKGAAMTEDWVQEWRDAVGQKGLKNMATGEIESGNENKPGYVNV